MATREENLKKINDQLELLSDEQLEKVAGGNYEETACDSVILSSYGLCKKYSDADIMFDSSTDKEEEVKSAWAKVGIELEYHSGVGGFGKFNKYFMNGQEIPRDKALAHLTAFYDPNSGVVG